MSTELMLLTANGTELTELDALIMAELAEETTAFDVQYPRVKIAPGGIGQFQLGDEMAKSFTAIVAISQKIRGYWPKKESGSAPPVCSSKDSLHGHFDAGLSEEEFKAAASAHMVHPAIPLLGKKGVQVPEVWECARCPLSLWGSAHQNGEGKGQACKSMARLLLLIDGWALPALMTLPPTSLKPWGAYCSAQRSKGTAYFAVRTRFELDATKTPTGITYNTVKVSFGGALTLEQARLVSKIRTEYGDTVRSSDVESTEYADAAGLGDMGGDVIEGTVATENDVPF